MANSRIDWSQSSFVSPDDNELLCPLCSVVDQASCPHEEIR